MKTKFMLKYLVILLSFFVFFSCGEEMDSQNDNIQEKQGELLRVTSIPIIKQVKDINLIPRDQVYKDDKITKNNEYSGDNRSMTLKVCRDSNDTSFLFDHMMMYLTHYLGGRQRIHLESKEPMDVSGIHEMDGLLPFTHQMDEQVYLISEYEYDPEVEVDWNYVSSLKNHVFNFGSYVSISDSIFREALDMDIIAKSDNNNDYRGYYYMNSLKIPKKDPTKGMMYPILYKSDENPIKCVSPDYNDFEMLASGDFGFGIGEEDNHFMTDYTYSPFNTNNSLGLCSLNTYSPSFDSCYNNDNCPELHDAWSIDSYEWDDAIYYSMEYEIYPNKNHSMIYAPHYMGSSTEKKFNLIVTENKSPDLYNPNSYLIHFPMKPIVLANNNIELILNFKKLDIISNFSFNEIIQSAQVENRMKSKALKIHEEQKKYCRKKYNFGNSPPSDILCEAEFESIYNLSKECYIFLNDKKTGDDLLQAFEVFSNHFNVIPRNNLDLPYFEEISSYKQCIYQAWTTYNPQKVVKFHHNLWSYDWEPQKNIKQFLEDKESSSNGFHCTDDAYPCKDDRSECSDYYCIGVECQEHNDCDSNIFLDGYGMGCYLETLDKEHLNERRCNVRLDYALQYFNSEFNSSVTYLQDIEGSDRNYQINITPNKTDHQVLFIGGSDKVFEILMGYNYYRFIRTPKNCSLGDCTPKICENNDDCKDLESSNKIVYGCYFDSNDIAGVNSINNGLCSTPLSAITNESKTIGINNGVDLWVRTNLTGSISTEDWNESRNRLGITFDTIFFSIVRQNNKTVVLDTFTFDNQHESIITEINDFEGLPDSTVDFAIDLLDPSSLLVEALVFSNIFDTKLSIFENIDEKFEKLGDDITGWIEDKFPNTGFQDKYLKTINIEDINQTLINNGLVVNP